VIALVAAIALVPRVGIGEVMGDSTVLVANVKKPGLVRPGGEMRGRGLLWVGVSAGTKRGAGFRDFGWRVVEN